MVVVGCKTPNIIGTGKKSIPLFSSNVAIANLTLHGDLTGKPTSKWGILHCNVWCPGSGWIPQATTLLASVSVIPELERSWKIAESRMERGEEKAERSDRWRLFSGRMMFWSAFFFWKMPGMGLGTRRTQRLTRDQGHAVLPASIGRVPHCFPQQECCVHWWFMAWDRLPLLQLLILMFSVAGHLFGW